MEDKRTNAFPTLEESWGRVLNSEFSKEYMINLNKNLFELRSSGKKIFPEPENLFASMNATPLHNVRVVILGQDPYTHQGQANGFSFSVNLGVALPPSLKNIYKEILRSTNGLEASNGSLIGWAKQGVLLLNSILTVEEGLPRSHSNMGWEKFTDEIIRALDQTDKLVFMLWGKNASKKGVFIDKTKHLVLESSHPSPLSAHRGFLGNNHFPKCNKFLKENNFQEIIW